MVILVQVMFPSTTTKVNYGDETFRHNMSLFCHRIHMVMKLWRNSIRHLSSVIECIGDENVSSPIKKMIGDEIFLSLIKKDRWLKTFVTKPYFQWRNILSPNVFFFLFNFNRLGDEVLCNRFDLIFFLIFYL